MAEKSTSALRDKAASVIGQYLLQGYRMLATHCPECGVSKQYTNYNNYICMTRPSIISIQTVLLQKKDGSKFCVLCHELLPQDKGILWGSTLIPHN